MKFEFAKYTDVTEMAFRNNPEYESNSYIKIYLCPDVNDVWLARILEGVNEDYEPEEGSYILEREKIPNDVKGQKMTISRAINIIKEDSFENWDIEVSEDLEELIEMLDDGFGIN